jgi:hypothetical protein
MFWLLILRVNFKTQIPFRIEGDLKINELISCITESPIINLMLHFLSWMVCTIQVL